MSVSRNLFLAPALFTRHAANNSTKIRVRLLHSTSTTRTQVDHWGKRVVVGFAVGSVIGGGYALYQYLNQPHGIITFTAPPQIEVNRYHLNKLPDNPISRTIKYPGDTAGLKLTLYQYQTCPFCCKVRTLLDFLGVSYNVVEVNPVLRTQLKWSDKYKKVPILIVETGEGEILQLNDSTMIISTLYSFLQGNGNESLKLSNYAEFYPTTVSYKKDGKHEADILNKYFLMFGESAGKGQQQSKDEILKERKWRQWADSVYVHTLSPNIYRTIPEALDSFRYFDQVGEWDKNFSQWERTLVIYVGAAAMWMIGKRLQKRHHLKSDVRQSLYDESDHWMRTIKKNGDEFMGGSKPNLADLAVYGVLSSIEGCQAFKDLDAHSSIVSDWYYKVKQSLQQPEVIRASALSA